MIHVKGKSAIALHQLAGSAGGQPEIRSPHLISEPLLRFSCAVYQTQCVAVCPGFKELVQDLCTQSFVIALLLLGALCKELKRKRIIMESTLSRFCSDVLFSTNDQKIGGEKASAVLSDVNI